MDVQEILVLVTISVLLGVVVACSNGKCKLLDECKSDSDCEDGLYCFSCLGIFSTSKCIRSSVTNQFKLLNNSLPFNKYAFLTTHNSFSIDGEPPHAGVPRLTFPNQEDTITQQLFSGVRAFMLDAYEFQNDVWLCHSNGQCNIFTAYEPAIETFKEIEAFLFANPSEVVTLILEDYVGPNGLTRVFEDSGLKKYWFPIASMPRDGEDWPLVSDMVAKNHRLVVFTSKKSKEASEGIAYQWNYMVENQYGDGGMEGGKCSNRDESSAMNDNSKSLVLTCYEASGNRWANFVAVDFYKRSDGGGTFQAVDTLNGRLLCGSDDVHACVSDQYQ